jgi:magnesium transporter
MKVYDIVNNFKEVTENFELGRSRYWFVLASNELEKIKDLILIDEESIKECESVGQAAQINFFDGYIFITLNVLNYYKKIVEADEFNIFLSKDYIITVFKKDLILIKDLICDIKSSKNCFILRDIPRPCILLYYILDRVILNNYVVISELAEIGDEIEINILGNPNHEQIEELINLRRQVYCMRKYLNPLRYIGDSLIGNDNLIIDNRYILYFEKINNKIDKLMLSFDSLVNDLALVREAFESEIGNKTNDLLKVFTLIATIFLPLNLITSLHGMNVMDTPFENIKYGFYYIILMMISISLFLIFLFKKKKWL